MNVPWHLLEAYFDADLTPSQEIELREWLASDPEHIRVFIRETHLHYRLRCESLASRTFSVVMPNIAESELPSHGTTREHEAEIEEAPLIAFSEPVMARTAWKARSLFALAAAIALLLGVAVSLFPRTNDKPMLLLALGASATIQRSGNTFAARDRMQIEGGDVLWVSGTNAVAIDYAPEKTRVEVSPGAELKRTVLPWGKNFELRTGRIEASVARQRPLRSLVIRTPNAEARVLGTQFTLTVKTNHTRLDVREGKVKLTRASDGKTVKVSAGNYAVADSRYELAALPATGSVLREYWTNLPGKFVRDLEKHPRFPDHPDGREVLKEFEAPSNWGDNYGARFRGYVHPPLKGDYTFWIAGSDEFYLDISPDDDPTAKVRICYGRKTGPREFDRGGSDVGALQSSPILMQAGRRYYIEVRHKAAVGSDHLAVAWRIPGGEREVIPGTFLSPFKLNPKETKR